MTDADWNFVKRARLGMVLPGDQITEIGEQGERIRGDTFAILFNAHHEMVPFRLGASRLDARWTCILDTATSDPAPRTFDTWMFSRCKRARWPSCARRSSPTPEFTMNSFVLVSWYSSSSSIFSFFQNEDEGRTRTTREMKLTPERITP